MLFILVGFFRFAFQFLTKGDDVIFQVFLGLWVVEAVFDRGFHVAILVTNIVALALELASKDTLGLVEGIDGIGQLDLIAGTWFLSFQEVKNLRSQEVAANDG